jgi:hypothetical protein
MVKNRLNKAEISEELEKKYGKLSSRELRHEKRKYAPKGGTLGAQAKKIKEVKFYVRKKKKPEIRIIDKTKK